MSEPQRPVEQNQGPASRCVINGRALGWLSCTAYAAAMGIDKATLGRRRPSGCDVRRATEPLDISGGLTLPQVAGVARREYGVACEVHTGSGVARPEYAAGQLALGRAMLLQGNTSALIRTAHRSTGTGVNHAVHVNEGRGWRTVNGVWRPDEALVYDPAADGRAVSWGSGRAANGPQWWPWAVVLAFAAALRPWGDNDPRLLGPGKWYVGIWPKTEPHVHLKYPGSVPTSPFPRTMSTYAAAGRRVNVRGGPSTGYAVVHTLASGTRWIAFQQNPNGLLVAGSRLWYGNHDGTLWLHSSGLR